MTAQAGDVLLVIRTYNTTTVGELLGRELLPTKSPTLVRIMRLTSARMNPRLDDFRARSPDELSMTKGDRIELIERDEDFNDGWYLGRHPPTGATGLFPLGWSTAPSSPFQIAHPHTYTDNNIRKSESADGHRPMW